MHKFWPVGEAIYYGPQAWMHKWIDPSEVVSIWGQFSEISIPFCLGSWFGRKGYFLILKEVDLQGRRNWFIFNLGLSMKKWKKLILIWVREKTLLENLNGNILFQLIIFVHVSIINGICWHIKFLPTTCNFVYPDRRTRVTEWQMGNFLQKWVNSE